MFEEPYRWVEAVRNRREYIDDQLQGASAVVALAYRDGALLATLSSGVPKLYEVYDQIAFGAMGHPADLEKLRNAALDMAHVEGFNRSPRDVTLRRLVQFGLAPPVKQAYEEVLRAPFIVKIVMAELTYPAGRPLFVRLNYDGVFDERDDRAALGASAAATARIERYLDAAGPSDALAWPDALRRALRAWAAAQEPATGSGEGSEPLPSDVELDAVLVKTLADRQIEVALLDRNRPGGSKYHAPPRPELAAALRGWPGGSAQ